MKPPIEDELLCTSLAAKPHPITHATNHAGHFWITLDKDEALKRYPELSVRCPSVIESINRGLNKLINGETKLKGKKSKESDYTVTQIVSCKEIYELRLSTLVYTNNKKLFTRIIFSEAEFLQNGKTVRGIVTLGVTVKETHENGGFEYQQEHLEECCKRYKIWVSQQPKLR